MLESLASISRQLAEAVAQETKANIDKGVDGNGNPLLPRKKPYPHPLLRKTNTMYSSIGFTNSKVTGVDYTEHVLKTRNFLPSDARIQQLLDGILASRTK